MQNKPKTQELRFYPSLATTGRLRLVRIGSMISCSVAEESSNDFNLLRERPFGAEDVRSVHIGGQTGGAKAALDGRITDLRIRAESFPSMPELANATSQKTEETGWLAAGLISGLVIALFSTLGFWFYARQRGGSGKLPAVAPDQVEPARSEAAPVALSFPCAACGKDLKAKASLAGKKVRCPKCGKTVLVPETKTAAAAGADPSEQITERGASL